MHPDVLLRNTLFLASAVRSGSTYVAEEIAYRLQRNGGLQFFNLTRDAFSRLTDDSTAEEIHSIYANLFLDASGWASTKIHSSALSVITRECRREPLLHKVFFGPKARWIIVRRRDKIAQAVSLATARKTGIWHAYARPKLHDKSSRDVSFGEIESALRSILLDDVYLEAFSRNLPPKQTIWVQYEDVVSSGRQVAAAVIDLCGLGLRLTKDKKGGQVAKIIQTERKNKNLLAERFATWLSQNYHKTNSSTIVPSGDAEAASEATR